MNDKEIIKYIQNFEKKLKKAFEYKYKESPEKQVQSSLRDSFLFGTMHILEFFQIYKKYSFYSEKNEREVIHSLIDIKLQIFFILEIEMGQYNWRVIDLVKSFEEIPKNDFIFLTKLNIDQNMIYKTRILWERIMNFVYLIVTKKQLENKSFNCPEDKQCPYIKNTRVYKKKSKKTEFKNFLEENQKWNFMEETLKKIDDLDMFFRTPETHKFSKLRSNFMEENNIKVDRYCSNLLFEFINATYPNILNVLKGKEASIKFWSKDSL